MRGAWDDLPEDAQREARELARVYFTEVNPRTLPGYAWMKRHSTTAAELPHVKLVAFGRVVLDTCKQLQQGARRLGRAL